MDEGTDGPADGSTDETTATHVGGEWREAVADALEVEIDWREARYHLDEARSGSDEATRLRAEMQRLREEYARLIEEARSYGRALGPPRILGEGRDPNQRDALGA